MGSYSDGSLALPFMTETEYNEAVDILQATVDALEGYKGILYGQFMLTEDGPRVVEFNARFGDPEAMNTLPVLNSDIIDVLTAARDQRPLPQLSFQPKATVCKYAVPDGYPTDPEPGVKVTINAGNSGDALLYYASVEASDDGIYTTTSRSYAVVGIADTISEAESIAEEALERAGTEGLRVRHDIGTEELIQQRVEHMDEIHGGNE
jgi:phosphoribosylamine--glycine ligase